MNKPTEKHDKMEPLRIPPEQHSITPEQIHPRAWSVIKQLHEAGFDACLIGGCVRDLLVGKTPKDFDVVTNAHPQEIKNLFHNCRLIGRRFRLAHIFFGRDIIEVATYRGAADESSDDTLINDKGMIIAHNVYGSRHEDVARRDFTINAIYYDFATQSLIDYFNGMRDIQEKTIRFIGEPAERFREDPIRILRAIRFASKLEFQIAKEVSDAIYQEAHTLSQVSPSRLFDEIQKLFMCGKAHHAFRLLIDYKLAKLLFGEFIEKETENDLALALAAFHNTDKRLEEKKTVNPAFLLTALSFAFVVSSAKELESTMPKAVAWDQAIQRAVKLQGKRFNIPRRLVIFQREIIWLQPRLLRRNSVRAIRLLEHPRFRAAFDFLQMRVQAGEPLQELMTWWEKMRDGTSETRLQMIKALQKEP